MSGLQGYKGGRVGRGRKFYFVPLVPLQWNIFLFESSLHPHTIE